MTKPQSQDYIKLHFIVIIFGFTAILGRLTEVSALGIVLYRTLIASIALFFLALIQKKNLRISLQESLPLLGVGAIMSLHWICFFGSARLSTVAISLVTFSTTSFFTSILEPFANRSKHSKLEIFLGVLVVLGMYFVFKFESQYIVAILIGLFGAILSSFFSIINSKLAKQYDSSTLTFYELLGAFLSSIVYIPFILTVDNDGASILEQITLKGNDWLWLGILGLVCTVYPYTEMMNLLKKISAFTLNLSINLEPIYGIVMAYFIFGEQEKMTSGFYIGGVLIFLSVFLHPLMKKK